MTKLIRSGMIVCAVFIPCLLPAATVKMTQGNGVCHTFSGVPCCADWQLSATTSCEDDCDATPAILAVSNVEFIDVTVVVIDSGDVVVTTLNNTNGNYDAQGLPLDDYTVRIDSATVGGTVGDYAVTGTSIWLRLVGGNTVPALGPWAVVGLVLLLTGTAVYRLAGRAGPLESEK